MTAYAQIFCTVDDMIADLESAGGDVTRMYQAIRDACDLIEREIGQFIPVSATKYFDGLGSSQLFIPPVLAITSIENDEIALVADTDFYMRPTGGHWANGPYSWLEAAPESSLLSTWVNEINDVMIAGRWGMFERIAALSGTASAQLIGATTLTVSDGSQVSPGMVIKNESEQELVTGYGAVTAAVTTLNGAIDATDDEITLAAVSGVNVGEIIRVGFEQMKVTDKNTTTMKIAVMRGWNRTQRVSHAHAVAVDVYRTFNVERGVNGTTTAAHSGSLTISRYHAPDFIRYLATGGAILMMNKARSGFAGKTGNEQMGTTFYNDSWMFKEMEKARRLFYIPRTR